MLSRQGVDANRGCSSGSGVSVGKRWLHSLDHYRRLKDEDPIIPFSEAPIISKWGAISRAARAGFHTTEPVQATACQGGAGTKPVNFKGGSGILNLGVILEKRKILHISFVRVGHTGAAPIAS